MQIIFQLQMWCGWKRQDSGSALFMALLWKQENMNMFSYFQSKDRPYDLSSQLVFYLNQRKDHNKLNMIIYLLVCTTQTLHRITVF